MRSRPGNGWDHAVAARGGHTCKTAWSDLEELETHAPAPTAVLADVEVCSNRQRCQAAPGYLAPLAYEPTGKIHESLCPEKC